MRSYNLIHLFQRDMATIPYSSHPNRRIATVLQHLSEVEESPMTTPGETAREKGSAKRSVLECSISDMYDLFLDELENFNMNQCCSNEQDFTPANFLTMLRDYGVLAGIKSELVDVYTPDEMSSPVKPFVIEYMRSVLDIQGESETWSTKLAEEYFFRIMSETFNKKREYPQEPLMLVASIMKALVVNE